MKRNNGMTFDCARALYAQKALAAALVFAAICVFLLSCGGGGGGGGGAVGASGDSTKITIPLSFSGGKSVTTERASFSDGVMGLGWDTMTLKVTQKHNGATTVLYEETHSAGANPDVITVMAKVGARIDATASFHIPAANSVTGQDDTSTASGAIESVVSGKNTLTLYMQYKCLLITDPDAAPIVCYYTAKTGFTVPKIVTHQGMRYNVVGAYELTAAGLGAPLSLNTRISQMGNFSIAVDLTPVAPGTPEPDPEPEPEPPFVLNADGLIITINATAINADGLLEIPSALEGGTPINGFSSSCTIPNTVSVVDMGASSVTALPDLLFNGYTDLQSITFPSTLESIGNGTFTGCTGLQTVTLPSNLSSIGSSAFKGCTGLQTVSFPSSLTAMGTEAFRDCTILDTLSGFDSTQLIMISGQAFKGCTALSSIQMPTTVTSIGVEAFKNSGVNSIGFSSNLETIEDSAFGNCLVTEVTLPVSIQSIGKSVFADCAQLETVTIPGNNLTTIGQRVFYYCGSLTSVTLGAGLTTLGANMFQGCSSLTSITIPDGITNIGSSVFADCSALSSVTLTEGLTTLGETMFQNCSALVSIVLPDSLGEIGENAFRYCENLQNVNISGTNNKLPPRVTELKAGVFNGCGSLTQLNTNNVTELKYACFASTGLTSLTMPKVTRINGAAWEGCSGSLTDLHFGLSAPPNIVDNDFSFYPDSITIHLPSGTDEDTWRDSGFVQAFAWTDPVDINNDYGS